VSFFVFPFGNAAVSTGILVPDSLSVHEPVVLVTGFEAFGNYEVNPSQLIAETLDGQVLNDVRILGLVLPVDFNESVECVLQTLDDVNPVLVVSTGLSAQCRAIHVEQLAWNFKRLSRNETMGIRIQVLDPGGPVLRVCLLNTRHISQFLRDEHIVGRSSFFPGFYVCNAVYYSILGYLGDEPQSVPSVFLHVPLLQNQSAHGMELDTMIEAVKITITAGLDFQ
jgi:pyroglutamyl-peptidase